MVKLKSLTSKFKQFIAPTTQKGVEKVSNDVATPREETPIVVQPKPEPIPQPLGPKARVIGKQTPHKKVKVKQLSFLENVVFPFFRNDSRIENILAVKAGGLKKAAHHSLSTNIDPNKNYQAILWHDVCDHDAKGIAEIKNCLAHGQFLVVSWKEGQANQHLVEYLAKHLRHSFFPPVGDDHYTHTDGFEYHFYQKA